MSMESVAVKEYIYHPINSSNKEIRLITIKAGREPDPVECSLAHVSLSDKPQYEALSYVWGNPNDRSQIVLEGCNFSVTSNLGTALSYLRLPEVNRTMWIDAICIDQSNLTERESQIQLMRNIYQEAEQVVSWIDTLEDEDVAVNAKYILREGQDNNFSTAWLRGALIGDSRIWKQITSILRVCTTVQNYWCRIWITQEVALARKGVVKSKNTEIPYEYFVEFSHTLFEVVKDTGWVSEDFGLKKFYLLAEMSNILAGSDIFRRTAPGTPLLDLLQWNQQKNATDPRDKVYALLGLSDMAPNSHEGLIVSYGENWSKKDVYTGVVRAVVHKTACLDIICEARPYANILKTSPSPYQEPAVPSWAPDWSDSVERILSRPNSRIGAAGLTLANVEFCDDRNVMKAQGICVGTVGTYGRCLPDGVIDGNPKEIMLCGEIYHEWLELCKNYAGDSDNALDALCRAITLGLGASPDLKDLVAGTIQRLDPSNPPPVPAEVYFPMLQRHMIGCRLFTIDPIEGPSLPNEDAPLLFGIGPEEIQAKDKICVLLGCKSPVALRPDGNRYRFVCSVFVDGLWDGQAIEGVETGRYSRDWFEMH